MEGTDSKKRGVCQTWLIGFPSTGGWGVGGERAHSSVASFSFIDHTRDTAICAACFRAAARTVSWKAAMRLHQRPRDAGQWDHVGHVGSCSVPHAALLLLGPRERRQLKKHPHIGTFRYPIEYTTLLSPPNLNSLSKPHQLSLQSLIEQSERRTNFTSGSLKVNFLLSDLISPTSAGCMPLGGGRGG